MTRRCSGVIVLLALLCISGFGIRLHEDRVISSRRIDGSPGLGGESAGANHAGSVAERTIDKAGQLHTIYFGVPPRIYRTLSQRSVGRYVLAGSSLLGECVRVYAPPPLSNIWTQLDSMLSQKHKSLSSEGKNNSGEPGLSYDKFMSHDDRSEEDEALLTSLDKYQRVSPPFLARHGISVQDDHLTSPSATVSNAPRATTNRTPVFPFTPISSLRRKRQPLPDDLDLLSEVEDEEEKDSVTDRPWNGTGGRFSSNRRIDEGNKRRATHRERRVDHSTSTSQRVVGDAIMGHSTGRVGSAEELGMEKNSRPLQKDMYPSTRNLIDGDDSAVELVKKLRDSVDGRKQGSI